MAAQVVCFGELLIDFVATQRDVSVGDAPGFIKAPGGAPANVAAGLAKLGYPAAFMGQVGDDPFGHYLAGVLRDAGVDVSGLRFSDAAMTPLAFVSVKADGERDFSFYRKPSADMLMTPADLDTALITAARAFHFGSITLIDEPIRGTTFAALEHARTGGKLISYDPNLRAPLWPSLEAARAGMLSGLDVAHVVKVSEEELVFLTGLEDLAAGVAALWRGDMALVVVTRGAQGCSAFTRQRRYDVPGFTVRVEDTIGAGDGFVAGLLSGLLDLGEGWPEADLLPVLRRANAVGALTASRQGAIPALPTAEELETFLQSQG